MITYLLLFALGIIWAGWGYVAGRVHGHSRHCAWLANKWRELDALNLRRGNPAPGDQDFDRFSANDLRLIFGRDS